MGVFGATGNPHYQRVPKDARHIIKQMLKPRASHHRASVLVQQVADLDHAVSRGEGRNGALPGLTDAGDLAQRVRLGTETRSNLARLRDARTLRVQQQLVKVIRVDILRRIAKHARRSQLIMKSRERARKVARWSWGRTRAGASWTVTRGREGIARARQGRSRTRSGPGFGRTTRVVGNRTPQPSRTTRTPAAARTRVPPAAAPARETLAEPRARKPREAAPARARRTPASRT